MLTPRHDLLAALLATAILPACEAGQLADPYVGRNVTWSHAFVLEGAPPVLGILTEGEPHFLTVDLRTGQRLTDLKLPCATPDQRPELYPPAGDLAFVRCGADALSVVDLRRGEVRLTSDAIQAKNADLSAGFRVDTSTITYDVSRPTLGVPLTLHDGRTAWLDLSGTLHAEAIPMEPWRPGYFCWPEHKCSRARKECLGFEKAPHTSGYVLFSTRRHGEKDRPSSAIGTWPAGLLRPGLVGEPESRCAFEWDESHLVLHDSAAFEPKESLLSLVSRDGTLRWSQPYTALGALPDEQPRQAVHVGDEILVLIGNRRRRRYLRAVLLRATSGEVLAAHDVFGKAG